MSKIYKALILVITLGFLVLRMPGELYPLPPQGEKAGLNKMFVRAVRAGDLNQVKVLGKQGADINAKDKRGSSVLFLAAQSGFSEIVRWLLDKGADVNAQTANGETPLHRVKTPLIADLLIVNGADLEARDHQYRMTPIFGQTKAIMEVLISRGAKVNVRAKQNLTPLMWLAYSNAAEETGLLISHGAEVNAQNDEGKTALHIAANWGHLRTAEILCANGAEINLRDKQGWTPLDWAMFEGGGEMADFLKSQGALRAADLGSAK